jgi:16S rRNA (adenine1518-N6/adenine1519-N6)-dimethyltransferase
LLMRSGLRPRKSLGQHFLEDPGIINEIISLAHLSSTDVVVEIGSGLGALTVPALHRVYHLVAVEKDPMLLGLLREKFTPQERHKITFISEDVLRLRLKEIYDTFGESLRILGNLPYHISSPFLEQLIGNRHYIRNAILTFQYELAQRLTAVPNNKQYGALTVIAQYYARISPLMKIDRNAFYPKPKVDSMVLEIDFETPYPHKAKSEESLQRVVRAAFSCRRKTILNSLKRVMISTPREILIKALEEASIDPKRRAETLTIDEYIRLSSSLTPDTGLGHVA